LTTEGRRPERGMTVWQPFRDLEDVERRLENVFGRPFLPSMWRRFPFGDFGWAPAIEIMEKEDKFTVKAELPGVKEEDINISVAGDMLTIEGEKKTESEVKKKGYQYSEASYGSFSRSIAIPSAVNINKIEASFEKGVLEITLPKAPEVKAKKITLAAKKKTRVRSKKTQKTESKKESK
jgi:HSP20 family protein